MTPKLDTMNPVTWFLRSKLINTWAHTWPAETTVFHIVGTGGTIAKNDFNFSKTCRSWFLHIIFPDQLDYRNKHVNTFISPFLRYRINTSYERTP